MSGANTRKVVDVDRGLFLVRYASAEDRAHPPVIRVSPGDDPDIRLVVHPDENEAVLRSPGACLVLHAEAQGRLAFDIAPARQNGSVAAKVTIEALNAEASPRAVPLAQRAPSSRRGDLAVTGHVAGRGDVTVQAGQWLAGPDMPARIEGLQLAWNAMPDGLAIRYALKSERPSAWSGRFTDMGAFAGSRGKALPVTALALEVLGESASRYAVSAEMIFLGAPIVRVSGLRVSGAGPTGREPLVGLRISIEERPAQRAAPVVTRSAPRNSKRVRVFHSEQPSPQVMA